MAMRDSSYRVETLFQPTGPRQGHACPRVEASWVETKVLDVELDRFPVIDIIKSCHMGPFKWLYLIYDIEESKVVSDDFKYIIRASVSPECSFITIT